MTKRDRILGVDYGAKRIGLAVSDDSRCIASPLKTYTRGSKDQDARYFQTIIEQEEIGRLVVGLPVHMSGEEGQKAREARAFGEWLGGVTRRAVTFWDERLTTTQAEQLLWNAGLSHRKRKERRDKVAAQMLLQSYLEAGCPTSVAMEPLADE